MKLSPEDRKQVRLSLLRYGARSISVGLATQNLRSEGFSGIQREEVQAECEYLADPDKGLMRSEPDPVSPEVRKYFTTAKGRDYLAISGQEQ